MTKAMQPAPNKVRIAESKKTTPTPKHQPVTPYGVSDPNGHVVKRIQHAKPALWAKIQNWD